MFSDILSEMKIGRGSDNKKQTQFEESIFCFLSVMFGTFFFNSCLILNNETQGTSTTIIETRQLTLIMFNVMIKRRK